MWERKMDSQMETAVLPRDFILGLTHITALPRLRPPQESPRVTFCGYSIPHPSDARVNIRVQTTGDPASEVLKDACQDLMLMCQHVRSTFDQAVANFKNEQAASKTMDVD